MRLARRKKQAEQPLVVGTGLIALDVIHDVEEGAVQHRAGGTCGNVLTILSYLGWRAVPLSRLKNDEAFHLVRDDFRRWNVETDHLSMALEVATPVIVEVLDRRANGPQHRYLLRCPTCGARLPAFRPLTLANALDVPSELHAPDVFFFDRTSPAARRLAAEMRKNEALIVFEPSGAQDEDAFMKTLESVDILKVAADRVGERTIDEVPTSALVIQTLGADGVRFRLRNSTEWHHLVANPVTNLRDSAGSGDWCTAGILSQLRSRDALCELDRVTLAVTFGQALAAWNCGFVGPRGGMYAQTSRQFSDAIEAILASRIPRHELSRSINVDTDESVACQRCSTDLGTASLL